MATTYEKIATTTLSSAASSISFSSIPATYTDLRLVFIGKSVTGNTYIQLRLNGDTGSNYSITTLYGDGSAATSGASTANAPMQVGLNYFTNTQPQLLTMDLFSYAGSTYKTTLSTFNHDYNGSGQVEYFVNLWRSTAAINAIYMYCSYSDTFAAGTTASLYGILKA
jgi:hypothetical protein